MQQHPPKIGFIGAGNMASAIIGGLVQQNYPNQHIYCYSPTQQRRANLAATLNIHSCDQLAELIHQVDHIILAVKPTIMRQVCQTLTEFNLQHKIIISLAAGIPLASLHQWFPPNTVIIRAMPNTPTLIGQGITGLYSDVTLSQAQHQQVDTLFQAVGETIWLAKEAEINALIAVTGSAPAYFFLFMEAMQNKARQLGFSETQAKHLIQQTLLGSVMLAKSQDNLDFATLRQQVTSKGGTTERAIHYFQQENLGDLISSAMQAAVDRAIEMDSNN